MTDKRAACSFSSDALRGTKLEVPSDTGVPDWRAFRDKVAATLQRERDLLPEERMDGFEALRFVLRCLEQYTGVKKKEL